MDKNNWIEKLEREGFENIQELSFGPDTDFPSHTHEKHTAHIILKGEMTHTDESGVAHTVLEGDRFDVSAGTTHSAKCGPKGCTFIVGEK